MRRKLIVLFLITVFLITYIVMIDTKYNVRKLFMEYKSEDITVVIDAGHGGFDPGKVGINKLLEKDINLSIAIKLQKLLEFHGINVIMTREEDVDLSSGSGSAHERKQKDMKERVKIINSGAAVFAISIHQNSFSQSSIKGAQVFYYHNSDPGKILAETLQDYLKETLNDGNHRLAKANNTYYLLKESNCSLVIVECGFLSNPEEAKKLSNDEYQSKVAWAIHLGVLKYLDDYYGGKKEPFVESN